MIAGIVIFGSVAAVALAAVALAATAQAVWMCATGQLGWRPTTGHPAADLLLAAIESARETARAESLAAGNPAFSPADEADVREALAFSASAAAPRPHRPRWWPRRHLFAVPED